MRPTAPRLFHPLLVSLAFAASAAGMQITGYQATVNDRFASGFPGSPVRNTNPSFIGLDFDWTGVAWKAGDERQGNGFLSPRHTLGVRHLPNNYWRQIFGNDGSVYSRNHAATVDLGLGVELGAGNFDLSVIRLSSAMPVSAGIPRYPVLDLNSSSSNNTTSNYVGRSIFLCGHWGWVQNTGSTRIGETTISTVQINGNDHRFLTPRTAVQLEGQDSGSPAFLIWQNPDGEEEIALIGNHAAYLEPNNFHSFIGSHQVMAAINNVMTPDGYALRIEGEPTNTWVGVSNNSIGHRDAWGVSGQSSAPSDRFVTFNGSTAGNGRQVNVNSNHNLRGLYFRNTDSSTLGMQFIGTSTLTIGRGGVMNLDGSQQVLDAPIALGDHQYWDAGAGGVSMRNINTNGRLLNIRSQGASVVRGVVSGSGGIALEGGQLHIESNATYTGRTWAHSGTLRVDGDIRTSERLVTGPSSVITGHGKLPMIQGNGRFEPDGILTTNSITPASGISFHFRFSSGSPAYGIAASSPNDLLRITGTPAISTSLTSTSSAAIYLADAPSAAATTIRGGFFFDDAQTSPSLVTGATWQVFVADPDGEFTHAGASYTPIDREWTISFAPEAADFADGTINGLVMQLEIAATVGNYEAWASSAFPEGTSEADRAPDAAPFGDGIPNLLAYALGLDPLASKSGGMPTAEPSAEGLRFRYRRNTNAEDISMIVESSADLIEWTDVSTTPTVINPDPDGDGNAELVEVAIATEQGETKRFARLRVAFANE